MHDPLNDGHGARFRLNFRFARLISEVYLGNVGTMCVYQGSGI